MMPTHTIRLARMAMSTIPTSPGAIHAPNTVEPCNAVQLCQPKDRAYPRRCTDDGRNARAAEFHPQGQGPAGQSPSVHPPCPLTAVHPPAGSWSFRHPGRRIGLTPAQMALTPSAKRTARTPEPLRPTMRHSAFCTFLCFSITSTTPPPLGAFLVTSRNTSAVPSQFGPRAES
jgi:hypothetical protein